MKKLFKLVPIVLILAAAAFAQVAPSNHVFIVLEENHGYSDINSSSMPYLTSLAAQYGLATNYYADTHPSIGNYFMLTTGQIITNDDGYGSTVTADNVVRHLLTAGKTFKEYSESIPSPGYTGGDAYPYVQHHNPLSYFSDVQNSSTAASVLVPFTQLATDINNNALPNYGFIVPNNLDNGHDGTLATADSWLKTNIAPLIASSEFQQDGILIVLFDEAATSDTTHGGGHVYAAMIGPNVKKGAQSATLYQHESTLNTMLTALGLTSFPGAAATAPSMSDLFGASTTQGSVTISTPGNNATVASPATVTASATPNSTAHPINGMAVLVDNTSVYTTTTASVNTNVTMTAGTHSVKVTATDTAGGTYSQSVNVTVPSTTTGSVTITAPGNNSNVASPATVTATATPNSTAHPINGMAVLVDNTSVYTTTAASVNTSVTLTAGTHTLTVTAADTAGNTYSQSVSVTATTSTAGAVTISSPANNATVTSPTTVTASATPANAANPINRMKVLVDNTVAYRIHAASLSTSLTLASGPHSITVQAWDTAGKLYQSAISVTVGTTPPPPNSGVTVSAPANNATVSSPTNFVAAAAPASSSNTIVAMMIYVDNQAAYATNAASLNTTLSLSAGSHYVVVQAWDSAGNVYKTPVNITVSGGSPPPQSGVTVTSPTPNSTVSSSVNFVASAAPASSSNQITAMQIYVDNVSVYLVNAATLNTNLSLSSGSHYVVVQAWDSAGNVYKTPLNLTVN